MLVGGRPIHIEVDVGVTADNVGAIAKASAGVMVAGSAAFKNNDASAYAKNIAAIRNAAAHV